MNLERYGPTKLYERLDKICVKRYGSSKNDVVSWVIQNNPGSEKYDIILPPGIYLYLPDVPVSISSAEPRREQIFLWD